MKKQNLRAHVVQMEVRPGRPAENARRMVDFVDRARRAGADVVVFPEMAVPGYLIGDEWERHAFLRECERWGHQVREHAHGVTAIFGNVGVDWQRKNEDGRVRKYNALFVAENGRFVAPSGSRYDFVIKTLLPNYREFDESRHFFDLRKLALEEGCDVRDLIRPVWAGGVTLGCALCEDAWDPDYSVSPLRILAAAGVEVFVNASCSPYTLNKNDKRIRLLSATARTLGRPLIYVNNTGIQDNGKTVFTFDGASCVYDGHGGRLDGPPAFEEGVLDVVVPLDGSRFGAGTRPAEDGTEMIYRALAYGTKKFMAAVGVERVTVGASGGIDSSVVAALYASILPPESLLLLNMPSRFNSGTTIAVARELAENLDCYYAEAPIEDSVRMTVGQLDGLQVRRPRSGGARRLSLSGLQRENIQARDRSARVLAAAAAAFGGVFTCNGNKAEMTAGYATLYGDLAGYLANIADLWKGEVYQLGRHLNEKVFGRVVVPEGAFRVTPSAELSAEQAVDEGKGDPLIYPYHDRLFCSWVEWWDRVTPEEILDWYAEGVLAERIGYEGRIEALFPTPREFIADLERWWGQYQGLGVAKRIQAPPVLAVKRRAFGFDHREAQLGARYTSRYLEIKQRLLEGTA